MYALGLDIGTTTISAVVVDIVSGAVAQALTETNRNGIAGEAFERLQDADLIWDQARGIVERLVITHPGIACIGLTGQMHGLLYADAQGRAASPLYTWQDGRGDLPADAGLTYAAALSKATGCRLATGYGAVTHDYNRKNGIVPARAAWAMTIQDYVGMRLTERTEPLTHVSDADSFGAPDWSGLAKLIRVTCGTDCLGKTPAGVPVAVAIGDNQASFIGSVRSAEDSVLINIGTGGQITMAVEDGRCCEGVEARPYVDGKTLLVGFSLCGGRAYALLERLFCDVAALAGARPDSLFESMNALADLPVSAPLDVDARFCGTRQDSALRGAITGICDHNLTPAHLVQGVLRGMVNELYAPYANMRPQAACAPAHLIGSGNGIRRNPALRALFEQAFGMPMLIPAHCEEAAFGAALFAAAATGMSASVQAAQEIIRY